MEFMKVPRISSKQAMDVIASYENRGYTMRWASKNNSIGEIAKNKDGNGIKVGDDDNEQILYAIKPAAKPPSPAPKEHPYIPVVSEKAADIPKTSQEKTKTDPATSKK